MIPQAEIFINAFKNLRRGSTKYGPAPHKPILLLSFIELFDRGLILDNRIYVNADLVGTFRENWELLVPTLHQPDFTLPFFHLQNDKVSGKPFWFLRANPGFSITKHVNSVNILANVCAYGSFSPELFAVLGNSISRSLVKQTLLETFFTENEIHMLMIAKTKGVGYLRVIESEILNEPIPRILHINKHIEEDRFVRNGSFKKNVLQIYDRTCSFSGMKMENTFAHAFIDACHIIPFAATVNDSVTNGIALCPNLHRAFDRGMITVDDDYRIVVSTDLSEDWNHPYSLNQLSGKSIRLPGNFNHYPSKEHLYWHREHIFKAH